MIVDCFTHIWDSPNQLGRFADTAHGVKRFPAGRDALRSQVSAGPERHQAASQNVDTSIVLGFKSNYLGAEIPNDSVASYVRTHPQRLIGFAGIDPSDGAAALDEVIRCRDELGMKGIAIAPAAQDFHPSNSKAQAVYEFAESASLPLLFHPGIQIGAESKLEYAQPVLLDEVARDHPDLRIIVAHMGYPWVSETLVLLAKHAHVYSDISWLLHQPWQAYQALLSAYQYGVIDKLLFGSGFPFNSATQSIEALYSINHLCGGTNLPKIPREALRGIVECNALELLGIEHVPGPARPGAAGGVLDEDPDIH